jgi:hypothetical protein
MFKMILSALLTLGLSSFAFAQAPTGGTDAGAPKEDSMGKGDAGKAGDMGDKKADAKKGKKGKKAKKDKKPADGQ